MLESGASDNHDNHVLCGSEGYQSETIVACFLVQIVFPDCWGKNTKYQLDICSKALILLSQHSGLRFVILEAPAISTIA